VDDVAAQLMDANQEPYIRLRNALFVDIAATVGLRRGSINSLTIDQFVRRELQAVDAPTVRIRPASQKFGYENDFEFPVWLALQVCDFVEGARADLVERVHKGVSVTRNRVFLSSRAAKPMTDRAMSQVVSRAMRAIGAPKGSAVHVLRSYYANEQIELEIDHRLARGLDTGTAAISAAVSLRLGHRNPHSLFAYVARAQSRRGLSDAARMRSEIVDLKTQVAQLREERARLLEQLVNKR